MTCQQIVTLSITALLANSADDKFVIFFIFFSRKIRYEKKYFNMPSAENFIQVLSVKEQYI